MIADIDPIHTTDQKPRPQFQPRPLHLVAHLPLLFATKHSKVSTAPEQGDYPSGNRVIRREALSANRPGQTFEEAIVENWPGARAQSGSGNHRHQSVMHVLEILERFADDPRWLRKRREALRDRGAQYPYRRELPPVLVDWIFVDDAWPTGSSTRSTFADQSRWTSDTPWLEFP